MLRQALHVLGFLSILPADMPADLSEIAGSMYLFPLAGALLGLLAGAALKLYASLLPPLIAAVLAYFSLLALTGLHHLDGLLDLGDALLVRGSKDRRIQAMHDTSTGAGGFAAGLLVTLLGIAAVAELTSSSGSAIAFFTVSETLAKTSMVLAASIGQAAFEGMGKVFIEGVRKSIWQLPVSLALASLVVTILTGVNGLPLLLIPLLTALIFNKASNALLGGLSGDVFGALNETTRATSMVVMLWMLS